MAQRALVIGSQTGGLVGVHADVEVVDAALRGLGFTTTVVTREGATRDGIVAAYRGLIEDTRSGDAAAVYYSGHGGRTRNALAAEEPGLPRWLHHIVPTDADDRRDGRSRVLLAEELSLLQLELTQKTDNVTTILDCCHSGRMSRDAVALPKTDPSLAPFPWPDLLERWRAAAAEGRGSGVGDSNRTAVRLVAAGTEESAYELADSDLGGPHGALTSVLVPLLTGPLAAQLSWREVLDIVRPAVMDKVSMQRPDVEGPVGRLLFGITEKSTTGVVPVVVAGGGAYLEGAAILGMAPGDRYALVPPNGDPGTPLATATVSSVRGDRAELSVAGAAPADLPAGTAAHPVLVALGARPVAVVPPDHPDRPQVVAAFDASSRVRVVDAGAQVLATVALDGGAQLLDAAAAPLYPSPQPLPAELAKVVHDVELLARATHLRELPSGEGPAALPDDVEVQVTRLLPDGAEAGVAAGDVLHCCDRVVVRLRNTGEEPRYVSVIDVGIAGGICIQTSSDRSGVLVTPGETYVVGYVPGGALDGIEMWWPESIPKLPRPETFVTVVADGRVDALARLEQGGVKTRGDGPVSALDALIDSVGSGRRDARPAATGPTRRYRVERFDFTFHPDPRSDGPAEPDFAVDARPDPTFRIVPPAPAAGVQVPRAAQVRLVDLAADEGLPDAPAHRLDALVVTASADGTGSLLRTATWRSGAPLPAEGWILHDGPVAGSLDVLLWVAVAGTAAADLPELDRLIDVPQLASAEPVLSVAQAAVAVTAALSGSTPAYRTGFLPHQRLGAGRHPAAGSLSACGVRFALAIDPDPPTGDHDG